MKFPLAYPHEIEVHGAGEEDDSPIHIYTYKGRDDKKDGWKQIYNGPEEKYSASIFLFDVYNELHFGMDGNFVIMRAMRRYD